MNTQLTNIDKEVCTVGYLYSKGEVSLRFPAFDAGRLNLALKNLGRIVGKIEDGDTLFYRFRLSRAAMASTAELQTHAVGRDELAHLYDLLYYNKLTATGVKERSAQGTLNSYTNVLKKLRGGVDIINYDHLQQLALTKRMGYFVPNPGRWTDHNAYWTYQGAYRGLAEFGKPEQVDEISKSLGYWRVQRSEFTGEAWGDYALAMIWLRRMQLSMAEGRTEMIQQEF